MKLTSIAQQSRTLTDIEETGLRTPVKGLFLFMQEVRTDMNFINYAISGQNP
jgi:hypothetical protein